MKIKLLKTFIFVIIYCVSILCSYYLFENYFEKQQNSELVSIVEEEIIIEEERNPFLDVSYAKEENLERYIAYKNKKNDLSFLQIVFEVNANLDYDFYTNITEIPYEDAEKEDVLVNKYNKLPDDFYPKNLVTVEGYSMTENTKNAYVKMKEDMKASGYNIQIVSAFRSISKQRDLYNNYVAKDGVDVADTYSARAGHSEHNTGLALDVSNGSEYTSFLTTNEYKWIVENSYKYGFIVRYKQGSEYITGYMFEAWHLRYVGVSIATYMFENNINTYEEYVYTKLV